ncbi:hypothetical protein QBC43DRAFT_98397 [Cladorrhinum sp. PSN259]|nr:hypothetical protein QBC43DRAFT_98397 [Cladorrhinum sp. PSN259]
MCARSSCQPSGTVSLPQQLLLPFVALLLSLRRKGHGARLPANSFLRGFDTHRLLMCTFAQHRCLINFPSPCVKSHLSPHPSF